MKHGLRGKKSFETRSDWCLYIAAQKLWVRRILGISQTNPLTVVSSDPCSALEAPDQRTDAPGEDYDDGEEVPVTGAPHDSQGSKEEVLPEKEDGMRSQTGEWVGSGS